MSRCRMQLLQLKPIVLTSTGLQSSDQSANTCRVRRDEYILHLNTSTPRRALILDPAHKPLAASSSPWPQWLTLSQTFSFSFIYENLFSHPTPKEDKKYLTKSGLMQMCESHWKASEQPNVCAFLKAVMMRVNPLLLVPQLSVWYLRVTKLVLVMMNPLLPTELRSLSQEMCACKICCENYLEMKPLLE